MPAAEPTLLWQMGTLDGKPAEFALGEREEYSAFPKQFPEGVSFAIGSSDPARHFPYIHPGPMDAWAGSFTITFGLQGEPTGTYLLLVALCRSHYAYPLVAPACTKGGLRIKYDADYFYVNGNTTFAAGFS